MSDDFHKNAEALPDDLLRQRIAMTEGDEIPDIWEDWSEAVRAASVAGEGAPPLGIAAKQARL